MKDAILSALDSYDLKPSGRNQYRCNSPLRPGSNSHAFAVTLDPEAPGGGVWFDHVADKGGDFLDLAPQLNISVPATTPSKMPTKERSYTGLDDYAQAHGVPTAVLGAAGWKASSWKKDGIRIPALEYPTPNGPRYRLIDGGETKYIQPSGYKACMYGLARAVHLAEQTDQPLALCNGEVSTIVAQHYGVAAFCQNMGEKKLTPENLAQLQAEYPAGEILLTPDCDSTGRRTAAELHTQLTTAGYRVRILDLSGADGFDLANFATLQQGGTASALLTLPEIPAPAADASMYLREMERLRQENEHLRAELNAYKEREQWQAKILARKDIKLNEKAVMIGIEPILHMRREMGSGKNEHSGTVPAAYKRLGEFVATSPSTVGKVIELGEKLGMWRRDPEIKQSKDGYEIQLQRLELLPAFDDPALAPLVERKQHGGARPNAGRKPKCPTCGPSAKVIEEVTTIVTHYCETCETILHTETAQQRHELQPDINQDEIEEEAQQTGEGIQDEIGTYNLTTVSSLPVPIILEETLDLTAAIRLADTFSPAEGLERYTFKTALSWLLKDPSKAVEQVPKITDSVARVIIEHLAARAMVADFNKAKDQAA